MACNQEKSTRQLPSIIELVNMYCDPILARKFAKWWNECQDDDAVIPFEIDISNIRASENCQEESED